MENEHQPAHHSGGSRHTDPDVHGTVTQLWRSGQIATGKRFIPNLPVVTHLGENRMFYDDLIRDRTVILQFMSIDHSRGYPATKNLMRVQSLLGRRLGRDVFMYSITVDPARDSLEQLLAFARHHKARPGWQFLTGEPHVLSAIKSACFFHGVNGQHQHEGHGHQTAERPGALETPAPDCSLGLLRYGNDSTGLWGSVPTKTDPVMIVERLSWIMPREQGSTPGLGRSRLKRRGPFPTPTAGV